MHKKPLIRLDRDGDWRDTISTDYKCLMCVVTPEAGCIYIGEASKAENVLSRSYLVYKLRRRKVPVCVKEK